MAGAALFLNLRLQPREACSQRCEATEGLTRFSRSVRSDWHSGRGRCQVCSRVGETERLVCTRSCNVLAVEVPHPLQGVYRRRLVHRSGMAKRRVCNRLAGTN